MSVIVINGTPHEIAITDPRRSLLDHLRTDAGLHGPKKGCDQGGCGACTVLLDGRRVLACLTLAAQADGRTVTTVEGVGRDGDLDPLQEAFINHDGFQCGYCTPGQVCSAIGMADEVARGVPSRVSPEIGAASFDLSPDEIRERMSGNLCRCGAYNGIVAAIEETYVGGPR
nr:2Fe-2S iron-sulfur cluster-binding protein [Actinoplanes auranticolor]